MSGEFVLIDRIVEALGGPGTGPGIEVGNGDDAAVLAVRSGRVTVSVDAQVEGVHFRWDICPPEDVGYKAVNAALSDLAAMLSEPVAVLIHASVPQGTDPDLVVAVARGAGQACREHGCVPVGGNVASTPGTFEIVTTVLGEPVGARVPLRSGAVPGDSIVVSGPLGSSSLGLKLLLGSMDGVSAGSFPALVSAYRRPRARLDVARAIAGEPGVHAVIDISDGLVADLGHVIEASRVGADVDAGSVPLHEEAIGLGREAGFDPVEDALTGGEDYELLAFVDPVCVSLMERLGMTVIGEVKRGPHTCDLSYRGKKYVLQGPGGYRHEIRGS